MDGPPPESAARRTAELRRRVDGVRTVGHWIVVPGQEGGSLRAPPADRGVGPLGGLDGLFQSPLPHRRRDCRGLRGGLVRRRSAPPDRHPCPLSGFAADGSGMVRAHAARTGETAKARVLLAEALAMYESMRMPFYAGRVIDRLAAR